MIDATETKDLMRQDCLNAALHTLGTGYIYSKRSVRFKKYLRFNNFLGIIIPLLIGAVATTYKTEYLKIVISFLAPLTIIQLVLSALSLVYKWDDNYSFFLESSNENSELSTEYHNLFKYTPDKLSDFKTKKEFLDLKRKNRTTNDNKYPLTDEEKRRGMRYGLRYFKRSCAGCNIVPVDMKSTKCGVCGDF